MIRSAWSAGTGSSDGISDIGSHTSSRCEVVGGSFFHEVPAGGDCYLLSAVVPNWDDAHTVTILRNVRRGDARPRPAPALRAGPPRG